MPQNMEQNRHIAPDNTVESLFSAYSRDVFRYAMTMLRDYHAAEDVTQEIFISVYRFMDRYRGEAAVRTWIFAIAKRAVMEYWRKNRLKQPYLTEQLPDPAVQIEQDMEFYDILSMLDQPSRDVVAMHLAGGLKHGEIAAILGETELAVKKRYSRAIKRLRLHMKKEE